MKAQSGDPRTLKPILPKLGPVVTRVIEINAPTMQMCKCFVCDERVIASGVPLLQSTTQASNTDLPTKIGQLMGEKFMVVVSTDDVLCRKCHALVNHVDKLESDLYLVKTTLRNHLRKKYRLNETDIAKSENEVEMEHALIKDLETEDHEPRAKRAKPTRPIRFRAIKPKPPGSVQLYKCLSCDFLTTEPDLLTCHRLVCTPTTYKCTMCEKTFDSQKMIQQHKIDAHLSKWVCHFCDISFNEEKKFTIHMKNHLGDGVHKGPKNKNEEPKVEKPGLTFRCPHCIESFEAFSQLQIHLVNHTSSVTFKCIRCDVGFQNKQELIDHVKTHGDDFVFPASPQNNRVVPETYYTCGVCGLNFIQEDLYIHHLNLHQNLEAAGKEQDDTEMDFFTMPAGVENSTQDVARNLECPNCGEKRDDEQSLTMHRLTECLGEKKNEVAQALDQNEVALQENPGEEASGLELNSLQYVNSLNVQLIEGNVVFQNTTNVKSEIDNNETEANGSANCVEDILENLFQVPNENIKREVKEEDKPKMKLHLCDLKPEDNKTFVCADCAFATQNLEVLKQHFSDTHEFFPCSVCKKNLGIKELRNHFTTDHSMEPEIQSQPEPQAQPQATRPPIRIFNCLHCSETFINRRDLHLHELSHPENLSIQCPDCQEKFVRDKALNEHREAKHNVAHCRFCNKSFGSVKQLKSHESRHLKSAKTQFKCGDCNRIFQTPTGLRHHKAIHTGEFKYRCEFCGKGFVSRVRYEEHRASHTKEARYTCDICDKRFSSQGTYWIHRKWHDNPTPYKCEYCGRLFKHSSLLSVHKRKHTGERPYECPHCEQSFTVGNTLKRHLMLHTGVFPFTCRVCGQGFSGKHKLAMHMSKIHQDNSLLDQQVQKKPTEYKMVVKPTEETEKTEDAIENQTWILTENDGDGSHLLTIKTEGENIPCTLLTDMMGNIVSANNRIVELIPYDSTKTENEEGNAVNFILMNQPDRTDLELACGEDFVGQAQVFHGETQGYNEESQVFSGETQIYNEETQVFNEEAQEVFNGQINVFNEENIKLEQLEIAEAAIQPNTTFGEQLEEDVKVSSSPNGSLIQGFVGTL